MDREERSESLDDYQFPEFHNDTNAPSQQNSSNKNFDWAKTQPSEPLQDFTALLGTISQSDIAPTLRHSLHKYIQKHFHLELTKRATQLLHDQQPKMSALSPTAPWIRASLVFLAVIVPIGFIVAPITTFTALLYVLLPYCLASMVLKGILTFASLRRDKTPKPLNPTELPIVTIFLPVHGEASALPALISALAHLDYPTEKLDLKFLVEETDRPTREILTLLDLPSHYETIVIPKSYPQTKPKAMNYALPFARGEIVGIYDAEDAPEPDQILKAVHALAEADADTVCVQARLNHYNATETTLSRMAQAEYTLWFDMLLTGLSRLRLPIPLGGTSLFIKTDALRSIDGWDPYNVTEDADLGLRLARRGWRAEIIDSTTWEEPPVEWKQWKGQRSRWIKGFIVTWLVHMRSPRDLVRQLGWRNTFAINIMLLDGFVAFLLQPLFWIAIAALILTGSTPWTMLLTPSVAMATTWIFTLGQAFVLIAAFTALQRRFGFSRAIWSPGLWLYWQCATRPAYRAVREMFGKQAEWNKTEHCLSRAAKQRRDAALRGQ